MNDFFYQEFILRFCGFEFVTQTKHFSTIALFCRWIVRYQWWRILGRVLSPLPPHWGRCARPPGAPADLLSPLWLKIPSKCRGFHNSGWNHRRGCSFLDCFCHMTSQCSGILHHLWFLKEGPNCVVLTVSGFQIDHENRIYLCMVIGCQRKAQLPLLSFPQMTTTIYHQQCSWLDLMGYDLKVGDPRELGKCNCPFAFWTPQWNSLKVNDNNYGSWHVRSPFKCCIRNIFGKSFRVQHSLRSPKISLNCPLNYP